MKALSIRQPWAWLIVNGHKTVENRSRSIGHPQGLLLIHASKAMTKADYEACTIFLCSHEKLVHLVDVLPKPAQLERGGIVGSVNVWGFAQNVSEWVKNPWYTGEFGYFFADAQPLIFAPCPGRLGFFEVEVQ